MVHVYVQFVEIISHLLFVLQSKSHNTGENTANLLPHKRRKNLYKVADENVGKSYDNSPCLTNDNKSDSLAVDDRAIEDCKKALIELSRDVSSRKENYNSSGKLKGAKKSRETSFRVSKTALIDEMKSPKNQESLENQNQNYLRKDTQSFVKFTDEYSSSSDEEPLIWENSNDGGYFTEWSRSSKLSDGNEIENWLVILLLLE